MADSDTLPTCPTPPPGASGGATLRFETEQLLRSIPAAVFTIDACGRIADFNDSATALWGICPRPGTPYAEFTRLFHVIGTDGRPQPHDDHPIVVALAKGQPVSVDSMEVERPDGSRFFARCNVAPMRADDGTIGGAIVVFLDVTAERRAQEAWREIEHRYRAVFHQASVGMFECDLQGRIVRTNGALQRLLGYSEAQLQRLNWRDLVPSSELGQDNTLADILKRQQTDAIRAERQFQRRDGSLGWVDVFATLIRDGRGEPAYGLTIVVDITDRKRTEAKLRETEARFRAAADTAPVLIWILDHQAQCTWVNQPWLDFVGAPLAQELGNGWQAHVHADDRPQAFADFAKAFEARAAFSMEFRLRRADGAYRWMLNHGTPRFEGTEFAGYIGSAVDITDRKAAEEAMHESRNAERARRQELEALNELAPAAIWIAHDPECREVTGNAAAQTLLGIAPAAGAAGFVPVPTGSPAVAIYRRGERLAPEDMPLQRVTRTGQPVLNEELEFRGAGRPSIWTYGSATPLRDEAGVVRGAICVLVDITERRAAEIELKQREEQLRVVADHASVFLAQVDRNLRYRFVNRAYAARYGREPHEIVGRTVLEVAGDEPTQRAIEEMERALAGERVEFEMEIPIGGEKRWGSVAFVPERDASGNVAGFVAVLVDITARRHAEMELERARDEALAASRAKDDFLAALSHELRTPLSPVLLIASEAVNNPELPAKVRGDFEIVRKSVELEARLIDDLLDLTRIVRNRLVMDARVVDVTRVVQDSLATIETEFRAKSIAVETHFAAEPSVVLGDPVRLQQVFWNVLKNAVKFTPNGGTVSVRTQVDAANRLTFVEVSDSGIGLNSGEIARVFEAFAQGDHASHGGSHRFGGLGLGLAISRRIVQLHGGEISASSPGRDLGSTFRIELPLLTRLPAATQGQPQPAPEPLHRAAPMNPLPGPVGSPRRVLLVEDHAPTRAALESLLRRRKLDVRSAANATEARALAASHSFDLLVSDIGLPDGTGHELMAEFRERYGLRGIALTGYGMEDDVARSQNAGFSVHLTKPVRIQSLDRALAVVLGQTSAPTA